MEDDIPCFPVQFVKDREEKESQLGTFLDEEREPCQFILAENIPSRFFKAEKDSNVDRIH